MNTTGVAPEAFASSICACSGRVMLSPVTMDPPGVFRSDDCKAPPGSGAARPKHGTPRLRSSDQAGDFSAPTGAGPAIGDMLFFVARRSQNPQVEGTGGDLFVSRPR